MKLAERILELVTNEESTKFSGGGLFQLSVVLYDMHQVVEVIGDSKLSKKLLDTSDELEKKARARLTREELSGIFKKFELPTIFKEVQQTFKSYEGQGKQVVVKHPSGRRGVTIDLKSLLIRFPKAVKEAEKFYAQLNISLRESKTSDALSKALASIEKQFGSSDSKQQKEVV